MNLTYGDWTLIGLITCILACTGTCMLIWRLAWHDGYEAGRDEEKSCRAMRLLRTIPAQEGIRAKTGPVPPWDVTVTPRQALTMPGVPITALDPLAGTIPMRRLTDTGAMRALHAGTDLFISRLQADGDAWRQDRNL